MPNGTARAIHGLEEKRQRLRFLKLSQSSATLGTCSLHEVPVSWLCAWGKFRQLFRLLTNCYLPLLTRGQVYLTCVRHVMLHEAADLGHEGGYTE